MNSADKVRKFAKDRKIPFAKIEKELGFSNGYIGQKRGEWPTERLVAVANYMQIPLQDLMSDIEDNSTRIVDYHIKTTEDQIKKIVAAAMRESGKYYLDDDAAQIAQEMKDNPGMRVLFDACRKVKPEDMAKVARMIGAFTEEE